LRDVSAFEDSTIITLLKSLREEAERSEASKLMTQGIAHVLCVYLARNYVELTKPTSRGSPLLPGFKLRRITTWMAEHLAEDFSLSLLAGQAGMSEYHFNRLFKTALGVPPSQHQIKLRIEKACRLLRETEMTIITVANEVGYSNPSHFSQIFRKNTGLSPSDYRRQR
jgi:AraC family transcriptional regulator